MNISKLVYWTPRVLSMLFICFLALFSFDVISPELSFWQIALGMFIHDIPVFILAVILWISWKREIVGGVVFTLAGTLYAAWVAAVVLMNHSDWFKLFWILQVSGPALLIGILFIVNWQKRRNVRKDALTSEASGG